jgi:hypothetical protein
MERKEANYAKVFRFNKVILGRRKRASLELYSVVFSLKIRRRVLMTKNQELQFSGKNQDSWSVMISNSLLNFSSEMPHMNLKVVLLKRQI